MKRAEGHSDFMFCPPGRGCETCEEARETLRRLMASSPEAEKPRQGPVVPFPFPQPSDDEGGVKP